MAVLVAAAVVAPACLGAHNELPDNRPVDAARTPTRGASDARGITARDAGHDSGSAANRTAADGGAAEGNNDDAAGGAVDPNADGCGPGPVGSGAWTEIAAHPALAGADIRAVWAVAGGDLFVIGRSSVIVGGVEFVNSHLFHWTTTDGWQEELDVPSPLSSLSGTAAEDAWAVGGGGIYHRDAAGWQQVTPPAEVAPDGLVGVQASAVDDVWFLGETSILHFQRGDWSQFQLPQPDPTGLFTEFFLTFWVAGPNDVWISVGSEAIGSTMPPAFLDHYDGARLTQDPAYLWIANILAMWGADDSGFWFTEAGFYEYDNGTYRIPALRRHDGQATTSDVFIPGTIDPEHSVALESVWGASDDDVWAVGSAGYPQTGVLAHFDGRCWRMVTDGPAATRHNLVTGEASSVWIVSDGPRFFRLLRAGAR